MKVRISIVVVLLLLFMPVLVFGFQEVPPIPVDMNWEYFVALLLNSFVIVALVRVLTYYMPFFKTRIGWSLPIITMMIGPLMALVTTAVSDAIGYPVDFSPIVGVFTGGTAVAFHQFGKQRSKLRIVKAT